MKKKKNKSINFKKILILLIILTIAIFIFPKFLSLSRYVVKKIHIHYLASKQFYFNCDKLFSTVTMTEIEVTNNWSGAEQYSIPINLNSKKNDLVCAPDDIAYNITFTNSSNITCRAFKGDPDDLTGQVVINSGIIPGANNEQAQATNIDSFYIGVSPATQLHNGESAWVELTVTSTSPYVETLQAKIVVTVGSERLSFEIADWISSPYLQLDLTNTLTDAINVTLTFDPINQLDPTDAVWLDMTSEQLLNSVSRTTVTNSSGYTYVNSITFYMDAWTSTTLKFYKADSGNNFTYAEGDPRKFNNNGYIPSSYIIARHSKYKKQKR